MASPRLRRVLATNIRRFAEKRGLALNTLADLAGVGQSHLYAVLGERRAASIDWIEKVAGALGVPAGELLRPPAK